VERILARIWGIEIPADTTAGKKAFAALAQKLLDAKQPGVYNQAMMDFGATVCLPRNPLCSQCPFRDDCYAFKSEKIKELPVKSKKPVKKQRCFHYLVIRHQDDLWVRQRTGEDIWAALWEFPLLESKTMDLPKEELFAAAPFLNDTAAVSDIQVSGIYRQTLSHQHIAARFWEIKLAQVPSSIHLHLDWECIPSSRLAEIAFPRIIRLYLEEKNLNLNLF
jgi:A/G-specific adenine glycosylase